jgi:hypothetical protein
VSISERALIFGGKAGSELFHDINVFDTGASTRWLDSVDMLTMRRLIATMTWSAPPVSGNLPTARWGHCLGHDATGGRVFVYGGDDGRGVLCDLYSLEIGSTHVDHEARSAGACLVVPVSLDCC